VISPTIECKNVSKTFNQNNSAKPIAVLHNIYFKAEQNEMIMLMGPSGSGKTTLLAIIGGILQPTSGQCCLLGYPLEQMHSSHITQFRGDTIGFLFQKFMLVPTLSAVENVAIPLLCKNITRQEAFKKAYALLESVGLKHQADYNATALSGGEQQRVALARAIIHNPAIILCDEPTSFLDSQHGQQIMQLLKDIQKERHATIIVVSHDDRILSFADRIVNIEDGRIKS
jgi:putative ABC transport system ATP-binding protein